MLKNFKFHIIAISLICIIVAAISKLSGVNTPIANRVQGSNRSIHIYSATWGLNCNPYILSARQAQANAPANKDATGQIIPGKPLNPVALNNVLERVKTLCEGKPTCDLFASIDVLALDPIEGCFKQLDVRYRCFTSDRLSITQTNQGELLKLNCLLPATGDVSAISTTHP